MRRRHLVWLHRWVGLSTALFLAVAGLTGSVLAFAPELSAWLDPPRKVPPRAAPLLDGHALRERALAAAGPGAAIHAVELWHAGDEPYTAWVEPAGEPGSGPPAPLGYDFIRLDPYTGEVLERAAMPREGLWPVTRRNLLGVLVALHRRLAIPGQVGVWLFGLAALLWTLDCFVGAALTFPAGVRKETPLATAQHWLLRWWNPSWLVKWRGSSYRVTFDLHRAGGLWPWALLLALAWSSVGLNLHHQIYLPVMRACFGFKPSAADLPDLPAPRPRPGIPWREAHALARQHMEDQARRRGFQVLREDALVYLPAKGAYQYWVRSDRDIIDHSTMTHLFLDAEDGRFLGLLLPTGDNAGNTLHTWAGALHLGMVGGLPYRIVLSLTGLLVAMLSVTGVWLWWRKRPSRGGARAIRGPGARPGHATAGDPESV